jgi:tRNA A37 threonylcarbamoyltransferase TsaD
LCTDNAVMIGISAYYNLLKNPGKKYKDIEADANFALK